MVHLALVGFALLAAAPVTPEALKEYEVLKARTGRDAGAQVRLALWCEAHGLTAERVKHLALAVLTDPKHATARGLLGLVAYRGRWVTPETVNNQPRPKDVV